MFPDVDSRGKTRRDMYYEQQYGMSGNPSQNVFIGPCAARHE